MKRILFSLVLLLMVDCHVFSQSQPYHVVFDLTSGDTATHHRVIRWMKSILSSYPDARLEVVFYGKSLGMVEKEKSSVAEDIKKLASSGNVTFAVCEEAMKFHDVKKSDLLDGVKTVPDAIYELISKQAEGYGYIKVVN